LRGGFAFVNWRSTQKQTVLEQSIIETTKSNDRLVKWNEERLLLCGGAMG